MKKLIFSSLIIFLALTVAVAGNPDRQGESGAAELLLNPWAKSAGLHSMTTSTITGVEAMRLNVAGIGRINGKEVLVANTRLFEGSTIKLNAIGYAQKMKNNGAFAVTLVAVDFGDIPVTTVGQPEGTGASFSPSFFTLGLGYSYTYENKISVGLLFRTISESTPDVSAFGFALDAGVQYVSGENDNFRLGISLRNVGSPMEFGGQGLSFQGDNPEGNTQYLLTYDQRSENFELPSVLNIGISYDFFFGEKVMLRAVSNFTSNAFSRDQIGAGLEFAFNDMLILRGGYKKDFGTSGSSLTNVYSGVSAGATVELPFNESGKNKIGVDYAYRATSPFRGTHNFSLRFSF
jgi:hypothetical protein